MWLAIGSGQIQRSLIVNWYRRCRLRPTLVSGLLISSRGRNFVFKALRFEIGLRSCTTTTTAVTTTTRPRSSLLAKKIWERKRKIWKYDVTDTIRYYFAYVSRRRERNTFANKNNCKYISNVQRNWLVRFSQPSGDAIRYSLVSQLICKHKIPSVCLHRHLSRNTRLCFKLSVRVYIYIYL